MRPPPLAALCLAASCVAPTRPSPEPSDPFDRLHTRESYLGEPRDMRVVALGGVRRYRGSGWGELDEQPVVGFSMTQEPPHWLLGLEGGMTWSGGNGDVVGVPGADIDSWEGLAGVMKTVPLVPDRLLVELGAGYALSYIQIEDDDDLSPLSDDDAWWSSAYARAALLLRLGDEAWIGLSVRGARGGNGNLLGARLDGDYEQLAFVLGARW